MISGNLPPRTSWSRSTFTPKLMIEAPKVCTSAQEIMRDINPKADRRSDWSPRARLSATRIPFQVQNDSISAKSRFACSHDLRRYSEAARRAAASQHVSVKVLASCTESSQKVGHPDPKDLSILLTLPRRSPQAAMAAISDSDSHRPSSSTACLVPEDVILP